jgi:hypothetical protein
VPFEAKKGSSRIFEDQAEYWEEKKKIIVL